jgi:hypothetical protein
MPGFKPGFMLAAKAHLDVGQDFLNPPKLDLHVRWLDEVIVQFVLQMLVRRLESERAQVKCGHVKSGQLTEMPTQGGRWQWRDDIYPMVGHVMAVHGCCRQEQGRAERVLVLRRHRSLLQRNDANDKVVTSLLPRIGRRRVVLQTIAEQSVNR